jgi:hypothetical protein
MATIHIKEHEPLLLEDIEEGALFKRLDGKDEGQVFMRISQGGPHSDMLKEHLTADQVPCLHLGSGVIYAPSRSIPVEDLGDEITIVE